MKADKVTLIEIKYPRTDQEKQACFLLVWQDWLEKADERIRMNAGFYGSAEEGLSILAQGIFCGLPEEALYIIHPLLTLGGARYRLRYIPCNEALDAFTLP
ncbi:MAG: hypothetical protein QM657_05710 [Lacrimispora sp.]|uniref:hypothetical protein n=1 Tax=Lacrimispora sp. TaxID=2719234 RepID=UPI0039E677C6